MFDVLKTAIAFLVSEDSEENWQLLNFLIKQEAGTIYLDTEASVDTTGEGYAVRYASGEITTETTTEASGLRLGIGSGDLVAIADTTAEILIIRTGSSELKAICLTTLVPNVYYGSNYLYFDVLASTYCHGINLKEEWFEVAEARAQTTLNGNYISYQELLTEAQATTNGSAIRRMFATGDSEGLADTTISYFIKYYSGGDSIGTAYTSANGNIRFYVTGLSTNGAVQTTLKAFGLGMANDVFLNTYGFYSLQPYSGRILYLATNKIKVGNSTTKVIKFKLNKLLIRS